MIFCFWNIIHFPQASGQLWIDLLCFVLLEITGYINMILVDANGLSPFWGLIQFVVAFWMVFRQLQLCPSEGAFLKDEILSWRRHWCPDDSWGGLPWTSCSAHTSWRSLSALPTSAPLPKSTINGWKSLKNGYPFDLSKVCHLVDIPITSKIKCVCLNIILMFTLGTKGQTADHGPADSDQFSPESCHFPCLFCYQSPLCLPPRPLSAAQALLKLTIIQFRIDQWECVVSKQNDKVCM